MVYLDLFKVTFFFLPWDSSPLNHHLGNILGFSKNLTLPETNIAPENGWLEY